MSVTKEMATDSLVEFFTKNPKALDCYVSLLSLSWVNISKGYALRYKIHKECLIEAANKLGVLYNPKELHRSDGRIIKNAPAYAFDFRNSQWLETGAAKSQEMIYLQSAGAVLTEDVFDFTMLNGNEEI